MSKYTKLTKNELLNNYEFKFTERFFIKKFPWITRFDVNDSDINDYHKIYITIYVDPYLLAKELNVNNSEFFNYFISIGKKGKDVLLKDSFAYILSLVDLDEYYSIEVNDRLNHEFNKVKKMIESSNILDISNRLPNDRGISVGEYKIDPNSI